MRTRVVPLQFGRAAALSKRSPILLCALKLLISGTIGLYRARIDLATLRSANAILNYNNLILSNMYLENLYEEL